MSEMGMVGRIVVEGHRIILPVAPSQWPTSEE